MSAPRRFHDARQVLAFPPYVVGALLWMLAFAVLCVADWISGSRHSQPLIGGPQRKR